MLKSRGSDILILQKSFFCHLKFDFLQDKTKKTTLKKGGFFILNTKQY